VWVEGHPEEMLLTMNHVEEVCAVPCHIDTAVAEDGDCVREDTHIDGSPQVAGDIPKAALKENKTNRTRKKKIKK
jgi:hypothetical protein